MVDRPLYIHRVGAEATSDLTQGASSLASWTVRSIGVCGGDMPRSAIISPQLNFNIRANREISNPLSSSRGFN